jgi:hypothetical protein
MSAHLYYENCPSATVFCGVVFPGAILESTQKRASFDMPTNAFAHS